MEASSKRTPPALTKIRRARTPEGGVKAVVHAVAAGVLPATALQNLRIEVAEALDDSGPVELAEMVADADEGLGQAVYLDGDEYDEVLGGLAFLEESLEKNKGAIGMSAEDVDDWWYGSEE